MACDLTVARLTTRAGSFGEVPALVFPLVPGNLRGLPGEEVWAWQVGLLGEEVWA